MPKLFYIIFAAIVVFVLISIWYFFLNIYEVKVRIEKTPGELEDYAIKILPLNSFGREINFRTVNYSLNIIEGQDFVKEIIKGKNSFRVTLKEHNKIKLLVQTEYSLFDSIIEIPTKSEEK